MESQSSSLNAIAEPLMSIINEPEDCYSNLVKVRQHLEIIPNFAVQQSQKYIIGALNAVLTKTKNSINPKTISAITLLFNVLFRKSRVDELKVFVFGYKFLLDQIYDHRQHNCVALIDEEHKLDIIQTMISLSRSLNMDVRFRVYEKDSALILCQMIYVALEVAKSEQYRTLRIACIECIMCLSQVDDSSDFSDLELRCHIADTFLLFLPGVTSSLAKIALEDEKRGHAVVVCAIKAWGRIVTLQMQNYNSMDPSAITDINLPDTVTHAPKKKWKTSNEVKQYLDNTKRSVSWYKETDGKLYSIMSSFSKLTHYSHCKVRRQLLETCVLLIEHCSVTIPKTTGSCINHLITLSEDEDNEIAQNSRDCLDSLSKKLPENAYSCLFQNLEENLYTAVIALPRIFNRLDENEQLSAINIIVGYLKMFGKTKLAQVLQLPSQVNHLIQGLIHITKIESKDVRLHDEYVFEDLGETHAHVTPWKNFCYFHREIIQLKVEQTCRLLAACEVLDITSDLLMQRFINVEEERKEATLLLNEVIYGLKDTTAILDCMCIVESILDLYMDPCYWKISLEVTADNVLLEVQDNIVQVCLQLEGLGKIALVMDKKFEQKMLKTLYPIFEYAGSDHSLIRQAATLAIRNISIACGYESIYQLIHKNLDYLTYHILRKLHKRDEVNSSLKALGTVLKYGNIDTLNYFIADLLHSCDKFFHDRSVDAYLHVFRMIIKSIRNSLKIEVNITPIKSKKQKELEHEPFQLSNMTMKDNLENTNDDEDEVDDSLDYLEDNDKKPLPMPVKLTEDLLKRCVNFLPSKQRSRKICVIEIFKDGLEIVRDWDNQMLPLVHQVWSPLIDRFKEQDDMVLINYSFQLLIVLARLSKDFIRSRTAKDVLPSIRQILSNLLKSSYLQDKGSAYRYTQAYKLQLFLLQNLGRVLTDLDLADKDIVETMRIIFPYLSKFQPIPIQESTLTFYSDLIKFDSQLVKTALDDMWSNASTEERNNYDKNISTLMNFCTTLQ